MSLVDAWIRPTEILLATDSDFTPEGRERIPTSKLLVLSHLATVMAARGAAVTFAVLFVRALSSGFRTFGEITR